MKNGFKWKTARIQYYSQPKKYERLAFFRKLLNDESVIQHILCMSAMHTIT